MIQKYTLDNGVRIVLEKMAGVRSVAIGIWIGTGSRHETLDNNGISHFIEHMLFKGTKSRSAKEIAETFDRIGGQVNAFTSKEYTCYYAKVLDQHIDVAFDVLADMYFNSIMDELEIEKEKKVVLEEISMVEDTPDDLVHDLIATSIFKDHPLGYSILGTEDTLKTFTREQLFDYVESNYTPENTVISIAGNVDERIIERIHNIFSSYERKLSPREKQKPHHFGEQIIRVKPDLEQAHICLSYPGLPLGDDDIYSIIILNNVLGGTMSSRLFQEIREERGLAYSTFSYHSAFQETGMLTIYAGTGVDQLEEVIETKYKIITDILDDGLTQVEVNNSKEQLKGSLMLSLEGTNSRMSRLGKNELLYGRHYSLDEILNKIEAVTLERIHHLSTQIFKQQPGVALISSLEQVPQIKMV